MDGLDIVRRVYTRLRRPSQDALAWSTVLETVNEVVAGRRLDLGMSDQNKTNETSEWFIPPDNDFTLDEIGIDAMLVTAVERRGYDSTDETGENVPVVNSDVLSTSVVGAVSFEGDPIRMVFRDSSDYIYNYEYRVKYTPDFTPEENLESIIGLPEFFKGNVVLETAYRLLDVVEDSTPEWMDFFKMVSGRWEAQLAVDAPRWDKYVKDFQGRAQVPKRTFWQNRYSPVKTQYFRG